MMYNVTRHLDGANFRAVVATLSPEPADSLIGEFLRLGVQVKQTGLSRAASIVYGVNALRRLAEEIQPALIQCHGIRADVLASLSRLQCPIVSTLHSDLFEDYRSAYGRWTGSLAAACEYAAIRRFDGVIAVSQPLAEIASRHGIRAKDIPNGIESDRFYPAPDRKCVSQLRARFGWPADAVVVLHTGVLRELKNPKAVLQGFRASAVSRQGFLAFAGDGPLRAECENEASGESNIVFLGNRNDVPDLLRASDILISASGSEGLENALIEACMSGLRILASDIPAHRYIQSKFPDQVKIFAGSDSDSVKVGLDGVPADELRARFQPPQSALEMFTARAMSKAYQKFYSGILRQSGSWSESRGN